jgi:hypothetical protein
MTTASTMSDAACNDASTLLNRPMLLIWLPMGLVVWQLSRARRQTKSATL